MKQVFDWRTINTGKNAFCYWRKNNVIYFLSLDCLVSSVINAACNWWLFLWKTGQVDVYVGVGGLSVVNYFCRRFNMDARLRLVWEHVDPHTFHLFLTNPWNLFLNWQFWKWRSYWKANLQTIWNLPSQIPSFSAEDLIVACSLNNLSSTELTGQLN